MSGMEFFGKGQATAKHKEQGIIVKLIKNRMGSGSLVWKLI